MLRNIITKSIFNPDSELIADEIKKYRWTWLLPTSAPSSTSTPRRSIAQWVAKFHHQRVELQTSWIMKHACEAKWNQNVIHSIYFMFFLLHGVNSRVSGQTGVEIVRSNARRRYMIEFEERINWNPHTAPINLSINSSGRHSFIKQFFARRRRRGRIFHALEFLKLFRLLLEFAIRLIINKVICQWPERFNGFNDLFTATLNIMKNYATENSPTRFVFFIRRAQFDGPKQIFKRKINIFYARSLIVHYLLWWKQTRGKRCTINAFYEMTLIIKLTWMSMKVFPSTEILFAAFHARQ